MRTITFLRQVRLVVAACCLLAFASCPSMMMAQSSSPSTKWHWEEGTIVLDTPARPDGQQHVVGLTAPRLATVRVGFVGLGMRGPGAVSRFTHIPGVQIVALCDYEEERAEACQRFLREAGLPPAEIYSGEKGYELLCMNPEIDLVYVATDWDHHFPVAKCALEHGKHTAIEVPSAMNLEQCWELINLSESTRKHCMILENCCYDWYELTALNMAQQGVFGEVVRAEGAYIHNLSPFWDAYWKNPDGSDPDSLGWRLKYNMENRGDVYATHGLGPVAQAMNIHRGDRFVTLTAMDTKSVVGKELVEKRTGRECDNFRNGDHSTTLMRTAQGKVVEIQHDVMTYAPYNRLYKLFGTKGYATKYPEPRYALEGSAMKSTGVPQIDKLDTHSFMSAEQQKALEEKYEHPILKRFGEKAKKVGGHGGMDFLMDMRLVYCLQNGLPLDMDVYDLAEWCSLAELGAISMDHNSASVAFPDFTRGYWDLQTQFSHAYASPEDEAAAEAAALASTEEQKTLTIKNKLWEKYDKAREKAKAKK
ncbi:MAG: Gfo/Idh/MocA family oxidoreductase [Bacteroidaceae bacterium]|nr:Gfo/Idh/MocA family oxidoreductase [Bacteroidaceae bacterium]